MYIVLNCVGFSKTKSISLQQNVYVVAHFVLLTKKYLYIFFLKMKPQIAIQTCKHFINLFNAFFFFNKVKGGKIKLLPRLER